MWLSLFPIWRPPPWRRPIVNKIARSNLEQAASLAASHNRSTVIARWRQCTRPSNTRFLELTRLTITNGSSISSAVFARPMTHAMHRPISPPPNALLVGILYIVSWPTRVTAQTASRSSLLHFKINGRCLLWTDRQTDRPTMELER